MMNSKLRKTVIATLAIGTLAAAGVSSAQAGKGGHGGVAASGGLSIYLSTPANTHKRHVTCTYRNKLVLNQYNQWVMVKVRNCH